MDLIGQEHSAVSWTVMTLAVVLAAVIAKTGLGVLRAYYILRVRAGEYQLYCRCWYHSSLGFEVWSALLDAVAFGLHVVANSVIFVTCFQLAECYLEHMYVTGRGLFPPPPLLAVRPRLCTDCRGALLHAVLLLAIPSALPPPAVRSDTAGSRGCFAPRIPPPQQ